MYIALLILMVNSLFAGAQFFFNILYVDPLDLAKLRKQIVERVMQEGDKHLILVQLAEKHNAHIGYVFNSANINDQAIIWARAMDDNNNLLNAHTDRKIWLLDVNNKSYSLNIFRTKVD